MSDTRLSNIDDLVAKLDAIPSRPNPILVAVAGAPGSGKSTIANVLHTKTTRPTCVIPMDGFHLDNETLNARGLLHRKGAPDTFDLKGFRQLIVGLRSKRVRHYPTFNRHTDQTVSDGGLVPKAADLLIVEGNYLLLDVPGWRDLQEFWDAAIWLDVPETTLRHRLVRRWTEHGLSDADAQERAEQNDLVNAALVTGNRLKSTWALVQET